MGEEFRPADLPESVPSAVLAQRTLANWSAMQCVLPPEMGKLNLADPWGVSAAFVAWESERADFELEFFRSGLGLPHRLFFGAKSRAASRPSEAALPNRWRFTPAPWTFEQIAFGLAPGEQRPAPLAFLHSDPWGRMMLLVDPVARLVLAIDRRGVLLWKFQIPLDPSLRSVEPGGPTKYKREGKGGKAAARPPESYWNSGAPWDPRISAGISGVDQGQSYLVLRERFRSYLIRLETGFAQEVPVE